MLSMPHITELVSHAEIFWLNAVAPLNKPYMPLAELVSHAEMSALNDVAPENMLFMNLTEPCPTQRCPP